MAYHSGSFLAKGGYTSPVTLRLLGVPVHAIDLMQTKQAILDAVQDDTRSYICVRDAHGLVRCKSDALLRRIHEDALLVTPDGIPLVWEIRRRGYRWVSRVCGTDILSTVMKDPGLSRKRHFLYGSSPECIDRLETNLRNRFRANIVGSYSPPYRSTTTKEQTAIVRRINSASADIVWVGLSTPKQEYWMARNRPMLDAPILLGVGAAFDYHAGLRQRAPNWIQRVGLEWLYRALREPVRLGPRYAFVVPTFLFFILLEAFQNTSKSLLQN